MSDSNLVPGQWTVLDPNQDLNILKGYFYAAVVDTDVSESKIKSYIDDKGIQLVDYKDSVPCPTPSENGRCISAYGYATKDVGAVPHEANIPLIAHVKVKQAWVAPSTKEMPPAPPPAPKTFPWGKTLLAVGGIAAAGGVGYWLYRRHQKTKRLKA